MKSLFMYLGALHHCRLLCTVCCCFMWSSAVLCTRWWLTMVTHTQAELCLWFNWLGLNMLPMSIFVPGDNTRCKHSTQQLEHLHRCQPDCWIWRLGGDREWYQDSLSLGRRFPNLWLCCLQQWTVHWRSPSAQLSAGTTCVYIRTYKSVGVCLCGGCMLTIPTGLTMWIVLAL